MSINTLPEGYILNNDYKILKSLGQGGFGITYLAEDSNLGHQVVIKEFLPQNMAAREQSHYTVSPYTKGDELFGHLLKRFIEEARLLAGLRHPNVVKVTRLLDANNTAYFVMDYEEGETLEEYLEHTSKLKEEDILSIMMPILEGTKYVHAKGILHRDIAPDNIYLKQNGMPILIDFGAARNAIAQESQTLSAIAKDGYSPPEQYTPNADQNPATDIYALGAVFYRMITGHKPANASQRQMALLKGEPDPIGELTVNYKNKYSKNLLQAIGKALDIHQERRFQDIASFQKAIAEGVMEPEKTKPGVPSNTTKKSNGMLVAVVMLFLIIGTLAGYIVMGKKSFADISVDITKNTQENDEKKENAKKLAEEQSEQDEQDRLDRIEEQKKAERLEAELEAEELRKSKEAEERRVEQDNLAKKLSFSYRNIESFLEGFVSSGEDDNVNTSLKYYAPWVSPYFSISSADHATIRKDKEKYYRKFPSRTYQLDSFTIIDKDDRYCELTVTISWKVYLNSGNRSGTSVNYMKLKKGDDAFYVVAVKAMNNQKNSTKKEPTTAELLKQAKAYYYGSSTVYKDYNRAKEYFLLAANKGSIDAYRYLGTIYLFGHGASIDKYEAKKWLQKGIDRGDTRARDLYNKYIDSSSKSTNYTKYKVINVASNDTLNVRTDPFVTSNNKVGELQPNAKNIKVLESKYNHKGTKWSKIEFNNSGYLLKGWVISRSLGLQSTSSTSSKKYKVIDIPSNDTLSVREDAGTNFRKIGDLAYYVRNVEIYSCKESSKGGLWCKISYGNTRGWVSAKYLREQ